METRLKGISDASKHLLIMSTYAKCVRSYFVENMQTRSGPKIPAAGYLEEERFLDLKNLSFGLMAFKMALKVHNGKWIGTSSEQPNLELGQNLDVQRK